MVHDLINWLAMGGYGSYIWSAYSITAAMLVGNGIRLYLRMRKR